MRESDPLPLSTLEGTAAVLIRRLAFSTPKEYSGILLFRNFFPSGETGYTLRKENVPPFPASAFVYAWRGFFFFLAAN